MRKVPATCLVYICFVLVFVFLYQVSFAGGLSAPDELVLRKLRIGECNYLKGLSGNGFHVTSKYKHEIELRIYAQSPETGRLKPGYQALPDTAWIVIDQDRIQVKPGESTDIDIGINIPADAVYSDKKYQFFLIAEAVPRGSGFLQTVATKTRICILTLPYSRSDMKKGFWQKLLFWK